MPRPAKHLTPQQIAKVRKLLSEGVAWKALCARFGMTYERLRGQLDPAYADLVRRRSRESARRHYERQPRRRAPDEHPRHVPSSGVAARLAEIPKDTRSLTGQIAGDPIPGDPRRPWLNPTET